MKLARTDRLIVSVAIILMGVLAALDQGLQYYWRSQSVVGKTIAQVFTFQNVARVKFPESFAFKGAREGESLPVYTQVYSGPQSQVDLKFFDKSQITLQSDSLVILEPRGGSMDSPLVRISKGGLRIQGNAFVMIDGRLVDLQDADARLDGDGSIQVLKGQVRVGDQRLGAHDRYNLKTGKRSRSLRIQEPSHQARIRSRTIPVKVLDDKGRPVNAPMEIRVSRSPAMTDSKSFSAMPMEAVIKDLAPGTHYVQVVMGNQESSPHEIFVMPIDPPKITTPMQRVGSIVFASDTRTVHAEELAFVDRYIFSVNDQVFERSEPRLPMSQFPPGEYKVTVRVRATDGALTEPSPPVMVTLQKVPPPISLPTPSLLGVSPENPQLNLAFFGAAPALIRIPFAPVPGASYYEIQVSDSPEFQSPRIYRSQTSPAMIPRFEGQKFIRVVAYQADQQNPDSLLARSYYSPPVPVAVTSLAVPVILEPSRDQVVVDISQPVSVRWTDPSNIGHYVVEFSRRPDFQQIAAFSEVKGRQATRVKVQEPGKYFVRVRSLKKSAGSLLAGGYSAVRSVGIQLPKPAHQIQLVSPAHRQTLEFPGRTSRVNFSWKKLDDISIYQVQIASLGELSLEDIDLYQTKAEDLFKGDNYKTLEVSDTTLTLTSLSAGAYAYRVTAQRAAGKTERSVIRIFRVQNLQQDQFEGPLLTSPMDGRMIPLPQQTVSLRWSRVSGAQSYAVIIASDPDFDQVIHSVTTSQTSYDFKGISQGRYYWRVWSIQGDPASVVAQVKQGRSPASVVNTAPSSAASFVVAPPRFVGSVGLAYGQGTTINQMPAAKTQGLSETGSFVASTLQIMAPSMDLSIQGLGKLDAQGARNYWQSQLGLGGGRFQFVNTLAQKAYEVTLMNIDSDTGYYRRWRYWMAGLGANYNLRYVSAANPAGLPTRMYGGLYLEGGSQVDLSNDHLLYARLRLMPVNALRISAPAPIESVGFAYGYLGAVGWDWSGFWGNFDLQSEVRYRSLMGNPDGIVSDSDLQGIIRLKRNFY